MKRLKLILIILTIIFLALLGAWTYSRNKAVKNGTVPPTFKQFLGIGTTKNTTQTAPPTDTKSSDFTQTENTPSTVDTKDKTTIPTKSSVFTNIGLTPTGATPVDMTIGGDLGGIDTSGSSSSGAGASGGGGGSGVGVITALQCSDEDTSITFTPDEINRLNVLKNRFFAIAETLRTDADVATEAANYDGFKAKADKIAELYLYCANSPVFTNAQATVVATQPYGTVVPGTNGPINYRVPTPFWHDSTKDNQAFIHQGSNWQGIFSDPDSIFPERSLEHALRLNLW